jgi:predicted hydrocarbon binding protein
MTDSAPHLVGVAIPTLKELRSAVIATSPDTSVEVLREAGFAGGQAIHAAFERWLEESGLNGSTGDLPLDVFGRHTTTFFRDAGWGDLAFSQDDAEGVAIVDIENCWEGQAEGGCHITTGMLAAFFGAIAGYPVAVLETECCEGTGSRCRFLLGNTEVMQYQWEALAAGAT